MDRQFTITVFLFISHPPPPPRSPHELRVIFLNFASSTTHPAAPETHDRNASARSCSGKHLLSHKDRQFTITVKNPFETCARSACVDYNHLHQFFCRSTSEQQEIPESYDKSAHFAPAYERSVTISATARQNISVRPSRKSVEDWHST